MTMMGTEQESWLHNAIQRRRPICAFVALAGSADMSNIRKPTQSETEKLDRSRELMQRGIRGEDDILSKISTTMRKGASDDIKQATRMRASVPWPTHLTSCGKT